MSETSRDWGNKQYTRLADYCIKQRLYKGHDGSHTDSVIREISRLSSEISLLREALEEILHIADTDCDGPASNAELRMKSVAQKYLAPVSEERGLTDTVKERIADPKIVDIDVEDL